MGLFGIGNKEKNVYAESIVTKNLETHPSIDILMTAIKDPSPEDLWLNTVCGYYDSRIRTVIVGKDLLGVYNGEPSDFQNPVSANETENQGVKVSFTELGYTPLPHYRAQDGTVAVEMARIAELMLEIVQSRLRTSYPNFVFSSTIVVRNSNGIFDYAYFTYELPSLDWKTWF